MTGTTATTARVERTYSAPAQAVFDAWTNPAVMRRWWHAGPDWETTEATADVRVGGTLRVVMRRPDGNEYGGGGEYTEICPPERLAFTWVWDDDSPGHSALIALDFQEHEGPPLVLTHSGLRGEDSREGHRDGWQQTLENLAAKALEA